MRAEAAAVEGQRQAAEQLATNTQAADKLDADKRAAQLQESLHAARAATVQAVEVFRNKTPSLAVVYVVLEPV